MLSAFSSPNLAIASFVCSSRFLKQTIFPKVFTEFKIRFVLENACISPWCFKFLSTHNVFKVVASNPVNYMNYKLGTTGPLRGTLVGSLLTIGAMGEGLNQAAVQVQASGALEDAISNKVDENLGEAVSTIVDLLGTLGNVGSTVNGILTSIESLLTKLFNLLT